MPRARAARPESGKSGSLLWLQGLACGALVTFATPTALVAGTLLAPVAVCRLIDSDPGRAITRAVAICAIPCALGPLWHLWQERDTMQAALGLLADPAAIIPAWAACSAAWASCQILPVLIKSVWAALDAASIKKLEAMAQALREEWDVNEN